MSGISRKRKPRKDRLRAWRNSGDLGIPKRLSELGVNREAIPQLVNDAVIFPANPRPTTKEDLVNLYERAI